MNEHWEKLATPPAEALKTISGGRLAGMTDINPQWRYKAMTQVYGECGAGWRWSIVKLWTEPGTQAGEVFALAHVEVCVMSRVTGGTGYPDRLEWSTPIPGVGGSMLISNEKAGLYCNDDAFKMAVTDALSVALKFLGVGSIVYEGQLDSGKYNKPASEPGTPRPTPPTPGSGLPVGPFTVVEVQNKDGVAKATGKAYTKYIVVFSDGAEATTFDKGLAGIGRIAAENGSPVTREMVRGKFGFDLKELKLVAQREPEDESSSLPF